MIPRVLRFLLAVFLCGIALPLPYRARVRYSLLLAWLAHAPFILFGRLAQYLLRGLGLPRPLQSP